VVLQFYWEQRTTDSSSLVWCLVLSATHEDLQDAHAHIFPHLTGQGRMQPPCSTWLCHRKVALLTQDPYMIKERDFAADLGAMITIALPFS
jgi:hypothetical protein